MGSYKNAGDILPEHLLHDLQKYAEGDTVYVPKRGSRSRWGERSGARAETDRRNRTMQRAYAAGASVETLADEYHLSVETVRKIVRGCRRE